MLRSVAVAFSSFQQTVIPILLSRSYSKSPSSVRIPELEVSATKRWLIAHENKQETLPRDVVSVKYSSGSNPKDHGK